MTNTKQILLKNNYRDIPSRDIYFNKQEKKIFSREFIEDNPEKVIKSKMQEKNSTRDWQTYLSYSLTPEERQELITEIENLP